MDLQIKNIWDPLTGILDIGLDTTVMASPEMSGIKAVWEEQRSRLRGTPALADFTEKLGREWAIETGILEGLYDIDRGVTQTLIEQGFRAELLAHGTTNRPREFVLQLIQDQKDALDGVFDFVKQARQLSSSWVKELHAALLRSQETTEAIDALGRHVEVPLIRGDWKTQPNSPIREGVTYAYCPPEQVASEMERLISIHEAHGEAKVPIEFQVAWLHHRFTQIHPFQDGNGRVARALASLVLVQEGLFPLVVTRDHRVAYIDSLEAADNGALEPLVELVVNLQKRQFVKAVAISEAVLNERETVAAVLSGLADAAQKTGDAGRRRYESVAETALQISREVRDWLDGYSGEIRSALQRVSSDSNVQVKEASEDDDFHYRSQIIENARSRLNYFANLSEFRHWVSLNMYWRRRAKLVFAIHGIGRDFNGTLICAPFLEFRDSDEDGVQRSSLVPVAEQGFLFFHNETLEAARKRFQPWRDTVFNAAMRELAGNL